MTGPEDTLARLRDVCEIGNPDVAWKQHNDAFPDVIVTDEPAPRHIAECKNDEIGLFVATFDPAMVRALLEYVEANEDMLWCGPRLWADARDRLAAARRALGLEET